MYNLFLEEKRKNELAEKEKQRKLLEKYKNKFKSKTIFTNII